MFEGFAETTIGVPDARIFVRHGGEGPAILLVHGHPRTSSTWHRVAPLLVSAGYSVVCADLRGYGRSIGQAPTDDHSAHSKRAVAGDFATVMQRLGHDTFTVVGHDRGALVALRLALDHPERVRNLIVIDGLPVLEHVERADADFATRWWHWFFFAQPDIPERVINADPDSWYRGDPVVMGEENHAEWRAAVSNPKVVRAMLEDYRAGLTIYVAHEAVDRAAGRKLEMPLLVLWSLRDDLEQIYGDPRVIWEDWASNVRGQGIDSGHHVAEEAPDDLAASIIDFLS